MAAHSVRKTAAGERPGADIAEQHTQMGVLFICLRLPPTLPDQLG